MKPRAIRNGMVVSTSLLILLMAMGCATLETARHKYLMRGQVLEVQDGTAYLCLGIEQGAKVGQVFTVRRYVRIGGPRGESYRVDFVGTVKITEVETHMARAKIITGNAKENDIVDLNIDNP